MTKKRLAIFLTLFLLGTNVISASDFRAVVDPAFVLLAWEPIPFEKLREMGVDETKVDTLLMFPLLKRFNVYRKSAGGSYIKLNPDPITPITDCAQIEALIPAGSPEQEAIKTILKLKSPCSINTTPSFDSQVERHNWLLTRNALSLRYYKIAQVRGLAYKDRTVIPDQKYYYELRSVKGEQESTLVSDLQVLAGKFVPLPAPTGLEAYGGDAKVFLTWNELNDAFAYQISRSTSPGGPYSAVAPSAGVSGTFTINPITVDSLTPEKPGFLDTNCVNNVTYYYKVHGRDLLGRWGDASQVVFATPRDMTPPETPKGMVVQPLVYGLKLTWNKVVKDIAGRDENVSGYNVYRYPSFQCANRDSLGIKLAFILQPSDATINVFSEETYPTLQPDTVYWYRIDCEDLAIPAHNLSSKSAAVFGSFKDTIPPAAPTGLSLAAFQDSIVLTWVPPSDVDLSGFNIYRGICGCESIYVYQYTGMEVRLPQRELKERIPPEVNSKWQLDTAYCCPYDLALIVNIDSSKANKYTDATVPRGSPICYRYAMKAYDKDQNLSQMSDSLCDRLRENTPPPAPVISALKARNRAIKVEWVAPPVQDLFGFVIERSESESGPWKLLEKPDFPQRFGCDDIPAVNIWAASSTFSFSDTTVIPKKTYWYRIRGADYGGNIGEPSVPIETYTFDFTEPPMPVDVSVARVSDRCALRITWGPSFTSRHLGFVVFRSTESGCCYQQVSPVIKANDFTDDKVVAGTTYWYKIQYFGKGGNRSEVSDPKSGRIGP